MHYANGREAKNGDRVIRIHPPGEYNKTIVGILHDAVPGNDACNGALAVPIANSNYCNLAECLHADDVFAAIALQGGLTKVPNTAA